jgi:hypothetical protein
MSKFKEVKDVVLLNGGYVSDAATKKPITHVAFVAAQVRAHRLISIAAAMKGKTFVCSKVDDINAVIAKVDADLSATTVEAFVKSKAAVKGTLSAQLAAEALTFVKDTEGATVADAVNAQLQEFKIINEFESHGLFFKPGVVKLEKIYTIKEIVAAGKVVYAVLNA